MEGLERDYPDRKKKPVDTGYGPYADSFPIEQHSFGPFGPIEAFYKAKAAQKPAQEAGNFLHPERAQTFGPICRTTDSSAGVEPAVLRR
jgi:hypothetical protein